MRAEKERRREGRTRNEVIKKDKIRGRKGKKRDEGGEACQSVKHNLNL